MLKRIQSRTRTPLHFKLFGKSNIRVDSYSIIRARYNIYILQGPLQQYLHIPGPTPAIFTYSRADPSHIYILRGPLQPYLHITGPTLQTYLHIPGPTPAIFTYSRAHCTLQTYLHIPGPTPVIFTYLMWEVWRKLLG